MGYIRLDEQPNEVYHYTRRKNLDSILRDGRIRRMDDRECWFCASLEDTVKRALDDLCRAGLLQKDPRWRENGSLTSNLYHVV